MTKSAYLGACAVMLLMFSAATQARIVCWTDERGARACGDHVPPQYVQQERQVYDRDGRVVQVKPRQKTPEELAADQARAQAEAAQRQRAAEEAAYDAYLTTTYASVLELERARDGRLATLDRRLQLAEESLTRTEAAVADLNSRIAALEADGNKVPVKLTRDAQAFAETLDSNRQAVNALHGERTATAQRFERDIARYRKLTME